MCKGQIAQPITEEELKRHASAKDCWVAIEGKVYNVTGYLSDHPGGEEIMLDQGGSDATDAFVDNAHSSDARAVMKRFCVGDYAGSAAPKAAAKKKPSVQVVEAHGVKNEDVHAERKEYLFEAPAAVLGWFQRHLVDERDLPMVHLFFNILVMVVPCFVVQYFVESHMLGVVYVASTFLVFEQRFILFLHYSTHRNAFKPSAGYLNFFISNLITPIFGMPAGSYELHHVIMHHLENNVFPWDLSSTMPYQRDKLTHFLHYWLRFTVGIHFELPVYAARRGRWAVLGRCLACMGCQYAMWYVLYKINSTAWLYTCLVPYLLASLALMFGNFSQHIFVEPSNPYSNYTLTYNCINHFENQTSFNDGYHVEHHVNAKLHWTEMPTSFMSNIDKYIQEDSFVFTNIHFMEVGLLVFTGQLEKLASHVVHLGGSEHPRKSVPELVALMKKRLVPIPMDPKQGQHQD